MKYEYEIIYLTAGSQLAVRCEYQFSSTGKLDVEYEQQLILTSLARSQVGVKVIYNSI